MPKEPSKPVTKESPVQSSTSKEKSEQPITQGKQTLSGFQQPK